MKRQLHIGLPGREPLVIDLDPDEAISVVLENRLVNLPPQFAKPESPAVIRISGNRWKPEASFVLEWPDVPLSGTETLSVAFVEADRPASPKRKDERYVEPEKDCSFCRRKASEVEVLIQGDPFWTRICNDCVQTCAELVASRLGSSDKHVKMPRAKEAKKARSRAKPKGGK
jgi:hypothetical protein